MLFPISELIKDHDDLLCLTKDTKVKDALTLMLENDYSQLPIVDDNGELSGIVTENSILNFYYHLGGSVPLLDIDIDHCQVKPVTIDLEADIFEALDLLQDTYAIIVLDGQRPIGILTDYDTTNFFKELTEGLILVQDIELTLKYYIENVFSKEDDMRDALIRSFKTDEFDPTKPSLEYKNLSLGQYIQLITTKGNWEYFEEYLQPRKWFYTLMDQVRVTRNQLAHFRGQLEPIQLNGLKRTIDWLEGRPKIRKPIDEISRPINITESVHTVSESRRNYTTSIGKYSALEDRLRTEYQGDHIIRLSFSEIEKILGAELPLSSREHRAWWANDYKSHTHSLSWLRAGWLVDDVDLSTEEVILRQSTLPLMQLFFADLLARLKKMRPGATRATKTSLANWWAFGAGKSGLAFSWVFTGDGKLRTELYIDTGDKKMNKEIFDEFISHKAEIENIFGGKLEWSRLDNKQASRISKAINLTIHDPSEKLERSKDTALEYMIKMVNIFQPMIQRLEN